MAEPTPGGLRGTLRRVAGNKVFLRSAQVVLAAVILYYVWQSVSIQMRNGHLFEQNPNFGYLAVAWALLVCYYLAFAGGLLLVIRALGFRPVYRDVFKMSFAANLGKYLPGGVWQVAGKVAMAKSIGIDRHVALVASVVESAVSVAGGLLVFLGVSLAGAPLPGSVPKWPMVVLVVGIFVALHPAVFGRVIKLGMRLLKIDEEVPHLSFVSTIGLVAYYAVNWFVAGAAFRCFVLSLSPNPGANWPAYAGYYAAASVGGLLILFVPSGLGAREGFIAFLLGPLIPGGTAAAFILAWAARVWSTLAELALSGTAIALPYAHRAAAPQDVAIDDGEVR